MTGHSVPPFACAGATAAALAVKHKCADARICCYQQAKKYTSGGEGLFSKRMSVQDLLYGKLPFVHTVAGNLNGNSLKYMLKAA